MKLTYYQIDAFTDRLFGGNPAGVCPLREWLSAETMQKIALENNQAETAFYVGDAGRYAIRWFTPAVEVDLCGHATLAAAFSIFDLGGFPGPRIEFDSRSGGLAVRRDRERLTLDFPADKIVSVTAPELLVRGLGVAPVEAYQGKTDYLLVFATPEEVARMKPDFGLVAGVPARGVIVTAPGRETDFVSRFFGPQVGINEDPVTGSAHTTLTPYWAAKLGKKDLTAAQLSRRGGRLWCRLAGDRVEISGQACLYLRGQIEIP
jgi:PhzF family phenazine biosynthesis protein